MGTQDENDVYSVASKWRARVENAPQVRKWELLAPSPKPESLSLVLTLKYSPQPEILEACEDGVFVFEIENHKLIALARHILDKLDPVTNEQLLEKIRKLVS